MPDRNLILTTAILYDAATLGPFVTSWRRHVPGADLVIFAASLSPATVEWLTSQGVQVLPADLHRMSSRRGWRYALEWGLLRSSARLHGAWLRWAVGWDGARSRLVRTNLVGLMGARWRHYELFLDLHAGRYRQVLFADARDTVFQADPFPVGGLHVFAENDSISGSHFARRWFQLTYGGATWRRLGSRELLCAGTTLGELPLARQYAALMCEHCLHWLTLGGEDQAVHNFLVHTGLVPAQINPFAEGVAINLNAVPRQALRLDDGRLVDAQGKPFAIVHQYDRVPGLAAVLRECRA